MKRSVKRKIKKKLAYWAWAVGAVIIFLIFCAVLFLPKNDPSIYISNENPKQGDTIFIRVKTTADQVVGNFDHEDLIFFKKGKFSEWIYFLGVDAAHSPGEYIISVNTSNAEHLTKKIDVSLADFSLAQAIKSPGVKAGYTNEQAVTNVRTNDNPALDKFLKNNTLTPYFSSAFSYPLGRVEVSGLTFGKFINFGEYNLQHLGVDLRASKNTYVYAVNSGKVMATLNLSNYGKTIIIDHGLDIFSMYLHLDKFKVAEGEMVVRGQRIGLSGNTGYATGPHLHFSMRVDGARVDPIEFIKETKKMNDNLFLADLKEAFLNFIKTLTNK